MSNKTTFTVTEKEPCVIEFSDPTATLILTKASVSENNEKEVVLKIEYEDFPDDIDLDNEASAKVIVKKDVLAKLTKDDKPVKFSAEKSFKPKLILEGPGKVVVEGEFKALPDFEEEEDNSENDGSDNDSENDSEEESENSD